MSIEDQPNVASHTIVLVHGTFARKATWTRNDGPLAVQIRMRMPNVAVVPFIWSGANSTSARIKAGKELAALVKSLSAGRSSVWIVGHSHGGNVALYALRDPSVRAMVGGLAFLGTPFLHIARRAVDRFARILSQTASWLAVFPLYMPFGAMALADIVASWLGAIAFMGMLVFGNGAVVLLYLSFRKRLRDFAARRLATLLRRSQDKAHARLEQPVPHCPTFVAWVSRDEAGLLLRVVDAMTFAPWRLYDIAVRVMAPVVVTYLALGLAATFYDETLLDLPGGDVALPFILGIPLIVVLAPWVISLFSSSIRGLPVAFGSEGIGATTLRIMPSPRPWWQTTRTYMVTHMPKADVEGLRHSSFYGDTKVISELIEWISGAREPSTIHADASLEADRAAERRRLRLRRYLLPSVSAIAVIMVCCWTTIAAVKVARVPKEDMEALSTDLLELAGDFRPVFKIDEDIVSTKPGYLSISHRPVDKDTDVVIAAGQTCVVDGRVTFANWGSSMRIALIDTAALRLPKLASVVEETPQGKNAYAFGRLTQEEALWDWSSSNGTTVSFRRSFTNASRRDISLRIRFWNSSSRASRIKGQLRMACRNQ